MKFLWCIRGRAKAEPENAVLSVFTNGQADTQIPIATVHQEIKIKSLHAAKLGFRLISAIEDAWEGKGVELHAPYTVESRRSSESGETRHRILGVYKSPEPPATNYMRLQPFSSTACAKDRVSLLCIFYNRLIPFFSFSTSFQFEQVLRRN